MFQLNERYRFAYKEGMSGADVWCIQIALNAALDTQLSLDGAFGPKTKAAAIKLQVFLGISKDGIIGPETQHKLCSVEAKLAQPGKTPLGLLIGICEGESGCIIPAVSGRYGNGSRDYGPYQDNKINPNEAELLKAFDVSYQTQRIARELNEKFKVYRKQPGAATDEKAWRLAVLYHNWPAAAAQIAAGNGDTWTYKVGGRSYKMSDPAQWVIDIGVAGVTTGWQWAAFYISSKIVYVTNWAIA